MEKKNFEERLPEGYEKVYSIDAKHKKTGLLLTLAMLLILAVVVGLALIPVLLNYSANDLRSRELTMETIALVIALVLYIILHELVHGAAYKALTHRKLTFGISWSCAFCGVPDVYVYRKPALIALLMPFGVFTLVFLPLTIWLYFVDPLYYLISAFLMGVHWGGCVGDLFVTGLFLFKFKSARILMNDTGPEQSFYVPTEAQETQN